MATINYTQLPRPDWLAKEGVAVYEWANVGNADECVPLSLGSHVDRSIQVSGTLDGASAKIAGTNSADRPYAPLTDPNGNDIAVSSYPSGYTAKIEAISEATILIKPLVTGGTAPSVTFTLYVRKQK